MNIIKIEVDEIPENCGKCQFCKYLNDYGENCVLLPDEISQIAGYSGDMTYRRSDCPLKLAQTSIF